MKPLHVLLEDRDFKAVREYLDLKGKKEWILPKPVINHAVLTTLKNELKENTMMTRLVVRCLEEFCSNREVEKPWLELFEEVSQLVKSSLNLVLSDDIRSRILISKMCHVIIFLGEKGEPLSSRLFNLCTPSLLKNVFIQNFGEAVRDLMLEAMCTLSINSSNRKIADGDKSLATHLNYLAKMVPSLPFEAQASAYGILLKFLTSTKKAQERAAVWFEEWPSLQNVFIDSYSKHFSEGCGQFLNKLFELSQNPKESERSMQGKTATFRNTSSELTVTSGSTTSLLRQSMQMKSSNNSKPAPTVGSSSRTKCFSQDVSHLRESFGASTEVQWKSFPKSHAFSAPKYAPIPLVHLSSNITEYKCCEFEEISTSLQLETSLSKVSKWLESQPVQCNGDICDKIMETNSNGTKLQDKMEGFKTIKAKHLTSARTDEGKVYKGRWPSFTWQSFRRHTNVRMQQPELSPEDDVMSWWNLEVKDNRRDISVGSSNNEDFKKDTQYSKLRIQQCYPSTMKSLQNVTRHPSLESKSKRSFQPLHSAVYSQVPTHPNRWQERIKELEERNRQIPVKLRSVRKTRLSHQKIVSRPQSNRFSVYEPLTFT